MTLPRLAQDLRAYRGAGVSLRGAVLPSLRACRDNGGRPGRGPVAPHAVLTQAAGGRGSGRMLQ